MGKTNIKSPFDSTMEERYEETAKIKLEDFIRSALMGASEGNWDSLFPSIQNWNATENPAPLPDKELRLVFSMMKEDEMSRRGINPKPAKKTRNINELDLMFTTNKDGVRTYFLNTENVYRILTRHSDFAGLYRFDEFCNAFEIMRRGKWRTLEDSDIINTQTAISSALPSFARISKDMVRDAMMKVSKECSVDTARDYVSTLVWDKIPRLDTWLTSVYGVEENEYHRAIGSNWLKGLVKRIVFPGCKFDYVLVLEGEQGVKKSTSLALLGGNWHVETAMSTETKDFFMQFSGKCIIEFSEGETLSRTEVKRMKAIITMQSDRYRMPYERATLDYPRRCVFAMTTNQSEYLKDETGNRRWLPVKVVLPEANIAWLEVNREQLFAEAYHRAVTLNETLYEFPKEDMIREQSARMIHDPNEDVISEWYHKEVRIQEKEAGITVHEVYTQALHRGFVQKPLDRYTEMMICQVLKNTLGLVRRRTMTNNSRAWRWFPSVMSTPSEMATIMEEEKDKLF